MVLGNSVIYIITFVIHIYTCVLHAKHQCSTYVLNSDIHSVLHSSVKRLITQVIQW